MANSAAAMKLPSESGDAGARAGDTGSNGTSRSPHLLLRTLARTDAQLIAIVSTSARRTRGLDGSSFGRWDGLRGALLRALAAGPGTASLG